MTKTRVFISKCASDGSYFGSRSLWKGAWWSTLSVPTAAAAVCARRRAAETREAMMSRSGCKESKVATGACAAPTQQHQHTPSGDGRRARWSPPRAEEMGNGVEKGAISQQRTEGGGAMVTLFVTQTQEWHLLTERFFRFAVTNLMFLHLRINQNALICSGHAHGHAQSPPPT